MLTTPLVNQKGGVGKTTLLLALASAAQAAQLRTLVIDLDPQGNASDALGRHGGTATANDILYSGTKGCAVDALWETDWGDKVALIPATQELAAREHDTSIATEQRLRRALDSATLQEQFDLCLIDCPPSLGSLVSNALVAADAALVVTEPNYFASGGVSKILSTIDIIRESYRPDLTLAGVILNKVDTRTRETRSRIDEVHEYLGDRLWQPYMPVRTALREAQGNGDPIHRHRPLAQDVLDVADTYLDRLIAHRGRTPARSAKGTAK